MRSFVNHEAGVWAAGLQKSEQKRVGASLAMFLPFQMRADELRAANINAAFPIALAPSAAPSRDGQARGVYARVGKRALDLSLITLALPAVALVIGASALALWLEGGRPFYRQDRLGRNGERFSILKLRTMVRDADKCLEEVLAQDPEMRAEWDRTQKLKNDPRITRVGAFLRRTSLDELPQLWNVVKGDMSLVGPRPMLPEQLPLYGDSQDYFNLLPGITGIWQVSARNESSFAYRSETDSEYRRGLSLAMDVKLLFKTVGAVLRGTGY